MKRTLRAGALLVLAAIATACSSTKIFEDIGSDPHPPAVEILDIAVYVKPVEEPVVEPVVPPVPEADQPASPALARNIPWDAHGFTLARGEKFQILIGYTDAGGDIEKFPLRDRDGSLKSDCVPKEMTYFPGTSGAVICVAGGYELSGIDGPHRLEFWAEDSHGSRSEKVEFVITLSL